MDIYKRKEPKLSQDNNLDCKVVLYPTEPFKKRGKNIMFDKFFTSLELGRKILKYRITIVRTIRKNKKELPPEFVTAKRK